MSSRQHKWILSLEIFISLLVVLTLFYYTYLDIVSAPYLGFSYSGTTGRVQGIYIDNPPVDVREGDRLVTVGEISFASWRDDLRSPLFPMLAPGELLHLEVERDGQLLTRQWPVVGRNDNEFTNRVYNSWWLGYFFWMTGLATLLLVRPMDGKRTLFAAFFFLTALWLVVGNTSRWGHAESRVIYRIALWLSVPVTLHLHWLFPRALRKLPGWLLWVVYGVTVVVCLLHWTPFVAPRGATLAYGLALLGSLGLLLLHYIRQPETRTHVRLLFFALLFAIIPIFILAMATALGVLPSGGNFALAVLPIIPGAYFYAIYRFQLGGSEFRANRLIAVYLYLILLGTALLMGVTTIHAYPALEQSEMLWNTALGVVAALITLYGFPHFQRLVERWLLGMPLPPVQLIDTYLARITTTLNESSLIQLLKDEVLPSLLIRQSALLRIHHDEATTIYSTGNTVTPAVVNDLIVHLKEQPVYRISGLHDLAEQTWVRLALALQVEGKLMGLWLLGRHDPDDLYSPVEIATLQNLARQTALALANIEQAAQLQALHQANIERQEQEHMKMAHFLHDAILNQAALLYRSLDAATLSARVNNAYDTLKEQIHLMVSNLRPPSLDLGLGAALEELAAELDERAESSFSLHLQIPTADIHYPSQIENHIFRIVQQACENAFRHANARSIQLYGTLEPNAIDLTVADDGVGFVLDKPLDITSLLAHKHFGLVHMMERAEHINAELRLDSMPGQGTRVRLIWSGGASMED